MEMSGETADAFIVTNIRPDTYCFILFLAFIVIHIRPDTYFTANTPVFRCIHVPTRTPTHPHTHTQGTTPAASSIRTPQARHATFMCPPPPPTIQTLPPSPRPVSSPYRPGISVKSGTGNRWWNDRADLTQILLSQCPSIFTRYNSLLEYSVRALVYLLDTISTIYIAIKFLRSMDMDAL